MTMCQDYNISYANATIFLPRSSKRESTCFKQICQFQHFILSFSDYKPITGISVTKKKKGCQIHHCAHVRGRRPHFPARAKSDEQQKLEGSAAEWDYGKRGRGLDAITTCFLFVRTVLCKSCNIRIIRGMHAARGDEGGAEGEREGRARRVDGWLMEKNGGGVEGPRVDKRVLCEGANVRSKQRGCVEMVQRVADNRPTLAQASRNFNGHVGPENRLQSTAPLLTFVFSFFFTFFYCLF